jgi:tetratricopeptide (TPR) repeat protein
MISRLPRLTLLALALAACAGTPEPTPVPTVEPEPRPAVHSAEAAPDRPSATAEAKIPEGRNPFERAYFRGLRLFGEGELSGATAALEEAVTLAPSSPEAWNAYALVAFERRDLDACLLRLDRALALRPEYREALVNRGIARFSATRYAEAVADFETLLAQPVPKDRITDFGIALTEWKIRTARGEIDVPFGVAVKRRLLPVDPEAMYAGWYSRLARLLARGPGFRSEHRATSPHYGVVTDSSEGLARLVAAQLERMLGEYRRLFPPPDGRVDSARFAVTVFARREDYVRYISEILEDQATAHISGGSYHPLIGQLYLSMSQDLDRTLLVAYHEGFHQYLDTFIGRAPPWFGEGAADYFGAMGLGESDVHPLREAALARSIGSVTPATIEKLLQADANSFMAVGYRDLRKRSAIVGRNYALAWAMVHFLIEGDDPRFDGVLDRYFGVLREGGEAARAYREAFGEVDPALLTNAFLRHARTLLP